MRKSTFFLFLCRVVVLKIHAKWASIKKAFFKNNQADKNCCCIDLEDGLKAASSILLA
jgi:hypothetical protein